MVAGRGVARAQSVVGAAKVGVRIEEAQEPEDALDLLVVARLQPPHGPRSAAPAPGRESFPRPATARIWFVRQWSIISKPSAARRRSGSIAVLGCSLRRSLRAQIVRKRSSGSLSSRFSSRAFAAAWLADARQDGGDLEAARERSVPIGQLVAQERRGPGRPWRRARPRPRPARGRRSATRSASRPRAACAASRPRGPPPARPPGSSSARRASSWSSKLVAQHSDQGRGFEPRALCPPPRARRSSGPSASAPPGARSRSPERARNVTIPEATDTS